MTAITDNRELRANLREVVAEMRADAGCFDQTDAKCIAIYDAVSRSNITRDVKTPERKAAVVREAMEAFR